MPDHPCMNPTTTHQNGRLDFRVTPEIQARVEALAACAGLQRSDWLRLAVAFTDTTQTLAELDRLEDDGLLTSERADTREHARVTRAALLARLRPKPLEPVGPHLN